MKRGILMIPLTLILVIIISALAVVRTKHENRALVAELDGLRTERERLNMEWAQLQLEEATLANNNRVEQIAREQLGMTEPKRYEIVEASP